MPIIVGAGGTVSAGTGPSSFNGFLVTPIVTPVTADLASVYTVPAGKTLYITNYYQGSASPGNLYINGVSLWAGFSGINAYTLRMPIIVGAGGTVSAGTGPSSFNGYLK